MAYFQVNKKPRLTFPTLTGSIITFNSQYAGLPLKSHSVDVVATQSGSGTPSPDNVRPITGYSAINISATGKNLLRINKNRVATDNGVIFTTNDDMSESISGELLGVAICRVSILVSLKAGTYILTGCPSGGGYSDYVLRIENSSNVGIALDTGNGTTFTIANDQLVYCRIYIYSQNGIGKTFYPMVRMVNTNSDYEPFGTYTTINIGQTVYGGEYDARTGVLTVTHKAVDLGTLSWSSQPSNTFTVNMPDMKMQGSLLCSIYIQTNVARVELMPDCSMWNKGWAFTSHNLVIKDTRYADAASFKTAINGIICVYELETPTTIQLPPCPIDTLEGVNNIWADTGNTTLQYPKFG